MSARAKVPLEFEYFHLRVLFSSSWARATTDHAAFRHAFDEAAVEFLGSVGGARSWDLLKVSDVPGLLTAADLIVRVLAVDATELRAAWTLCSSISGDRVAIHTLKASAHLAGLAANSRRWDPTREPEFSALER
eukprot:Amastigsp_a181374_17.p3 type:complete len:134 gc:universal Amastigsp_a181374_17:81-482(+)